MSSSYTWEHSTPTTWPMSIRPHSSEVSIHCQWWVCFDVNADCIKVYTIKVVKSGMRVTYFLISQEPHRLRLINLSNEITLQSDFRQLIKYMLSCPKRILSFELPLSTHFFSKKPTHVILLSVLLAVCVGCILVLRPTQHTASHLVTLIMEDASEEKCAP